MDIDHINHKIDKYAYKLKNATSKKSSSLYHNRLQRYHSMKNSILGGASSFQSGGDLLQFQDLLKEQFRVASERLTNLSRADLGDSETKLRELRDRLDDAGRAHDDLKVGLIDSAEKYSELVKKIEYAKRESGELNLEGFDDRVNALMGDVYKIGSTGNLIARLKVVKGMFDNFIETTGVDKPSSNFLNLTRELSKIASNTRIEDIIEAFQPKKWENEETRVREMNDVVLGYSNIFELFTEGKSLGYNEETRSNTITYVNDVDLTRDVDPIIGHLETMVAQLQQLHEALYGQYDIYTLVREGENGSEVQRNDDINKANLYIYIAKEEGQRDEDDLDYDGPDGPEARPEAGPNPFDAPQEGGKKKV